MSRQKKSRKQGSLGARKAPKLRETEHTARERKKLKKRKGLQPGTRQGQAAGASTGSGSRPSADPRLGSTKPVPLQVTVTPGASGPRSGSRPAPAVAKTPTTAQPPLSSPQQELELLEQDEHLNALLDRVDNGAPLSDTEQAWLDTQLARHHELMVLLGLEEQDEPPREEDEDALLDRFLSQEWQQPWPEDDTGKDKP